MRARARACGRDLQNTLVFRAFVIDAARCLQRVVEHRSAGRELRAGAPALACRSPGRKFFAPGVDSRKNRD